MKKLLGLMLVLTAVSMVHANLVFAKPMIKDLPGALKSHGSALESTHQDGVAIFFRSLEEDCDVPRVLNSKFMKSGNRNGVPALFRIESRVDASCLRREIWDCRSVFEGSGQDTKFTYKYTDCETDAPLIED